MAVKNRNPADPVGEGLSGFLRGLGLALVACIGIVAATYGGLMVFAVHQDWAHDITQSVLPGEVTYASFSPPQN
jgi:hypothetical protein